MSMHPLQPLLHITDRLENCLSNRNYTGAVLWCARMMPAVAIIWATDPPQCEEGRARWREHGAPVLAKLRAALLHLDGWRSTTGRRGVNLSTAWLWQAVNDACDVLILRGDEDQSPAVPAPSPDDSGCTPAAVTGG